MALINNLRDTGTGKKTTTEKKVDNRRSGYTQKTVNSERRNVIDYMKEKQGGTNLKDIVNATKTLIQKADESYQNSAYGKLVNKVSEFGGNVNKAILEKTGLDKVESPYTTMFNTAGKALNKVSDYLQESNQMNDLQKHHLDTTFSGYIDTESVYNKIKNDSTYASKLVDENGNLIDYTDQINKLIGQRDSTGNPYEKTELNKQIDLLKEYQADQNKLLNASNYEYLQKNGASEEDLNEFKKSVIRGDYNGAERALANFTSTVQSYIGNTAKGAETLFAKAADFYGADYQMSKYVDRIIDDAETLRQYSMQGASGMEKFVYEVYDGMAPFLYAMMTANVFNGSPSYLGQEEVAKALTNNALLLSDVGTLGSKMKQNLSSGYDFDTSFNNAFWSAALSHMTEQIGGESLANILTGKVGEELLEHTLDYAIRSLSNQFLSEAAEEGMEALIEPIIDKYTLNTGLTVEEYLKKAFSKDTAYQMFIGGMGGLAMGGFATYDTIKNFNEIASSIPLNSKADYNAALDARKTLQDMIKKVEVSGNITETDANQIGSMKMLLSAFNKRLNRFSAANPNMDAFTSASDMPKVQQSADPKSTILEAAAPDFAAKMDEIVQLKDEIGDQSMKALDTLQEDLNAQGINATASQWANLTEEKRNVVTKISEWAKSLNKNVGYADMVSKSGQIIDGLYDSKTGQTIINPNGENVPVSTLIHEFTHGTEASKYYDVLHAFVKEYLGDDYNTALENLKKEYSTVQQLDDEGAAHELVAVTTQELLGNEEFVDRLVRYDTSLAYQMYEEIKYMNSQTGTLEGIEQNFMRAFSDTNPDTAYLPGGISYSVGGKISFKEYVKMIEKDSYTDNNNALEVRSTSPDWMVLNGYDQLPMLMTLRHIRNGLGLGKSGHQHSLSSDVVGALPQLLDMPIAVYPSHNNSLIAFLPATDANGTIVVASIKPSGNGTYNNILIDSNFVTSMYGKDNVIRYFDKMVRGASPIFPSGITKKQVLQTILRLQLSDNYLPPVINNITDSDNDGKSELSIGTNLDSLRRKDLMAIHNLSEDKLMKSIDLGGFAIPSIAVTKDSIGHENYGDISLVFGKDTIDPSRKGNKVYGGDAWTGTYPSVEYDVSYDELSKVADKIESIIPLKELSKLGNTSAILSPNSMNDLLNKHDGNPVESLKENKALKYAYLVEQGKAFELPMKAGDIAVQSRFNEDEFNVLFNLLKKNGTGLDELGSMNEAELEKYARSLVSPLTEMLNQDYAERHPALNKKRTEKGLPPLALFYDGSPRGDQVPYWNVVDALKDTVRYWKDGARTVVDKAAFDEKVEETVDQEGYEEWLKELFADVQIQNGIRNDKDLFTSSGSRRSFKSLHDPYTLENIMKFMKKQAGSDSRGKHEGVFGIGAGDIQATQKISFKDIQDVIGHEDMLQNLSDEDVEQIIKPSMSKIGDMARKIEDIYARKDGSNDVESMVYRSNNALEFLKETIKKNTKEQMISVYKKDFATYPYLQMTDEELDSILDQIIDLKDELRDMPTKYFEAKPERIVGLNEIQTAVIPNTASDALKQRLAEMGINTVEYDPSIEGDRAAKINSLENLKFSKGLRLENLVSDARKELRGLTDKSRTVNLTETLNQAVNDIRENGDISEDTYNILRDKVIESTYSRMPNDQYGMAQNIREMIGNRFGRLNSENWDQTMQEINDTYHLYDEDSVSLNSLQDAQEFINDYLADIGGKYVYANPVEMGYMSEQEYEDMVNSKLDEVITNLKDGVQTSDVAEMLASQEDLEENMYRQGQENLENLLQEEDGMIKALEQASVGNLTPEELDQLEQISLEPVSIEEAKEQVSPVLKEAAKLKKPLRTKKDIFYQVRQKMFDKGIAIRDMKDRQLSTSYDRLLDAENMANFTITNGMYDKKGKKISDSLTQISKLIPESQKNDFDYYMYHKHNIDAAKYHKDVFMGFDAAKSKQIVNQYETLHPDWMSVADKYYKLNDALLAMQVENGVISQDMADRWKEMYPNYVPTKRVTEQVDDANIIETADPEVVSANKGTLYERTGGNSPIQPLDYAMAEHIKQIYRSARFNQFAKDYVKASHSKVTSFAEYGNFEDAIEGREDQVTKADEFTPATMIWYDNGDRMIVELPQNIYDAVSPAQTPFNLPSNIPFLSWASKLRTNMITGANPVFWATNAIKDFQDIGFNSKYAKDTYLNLPRAYKQLLTNGDIANLYKSQGGEYQTYTSEAGIKQNDHGKFYNATIGNFVKLNELIEMAPRLAEFMSSLDHGDSVDTAMYNAAEVTTNFKRGGDYAKWINRNGANFFNASIQGFDKQIRNIEDAYDSKGWKGIVGYMAKSALLSGVPLVLLNGMLHRDDMDYEELSDYIKDNYYVLWKYDDGKFVRIPKGRIANAWQGLMTALYEDGVELASDDDAMKKAQTIWNNTLDSLKNVWEQVGINDVGGNNIFSPIIQTLKNEAWYGDPIVSTYMQKKDAADQFDESTDLFSVWLGQKTNISPMKINYLIDQYSGGAGDVILPMLTPKAETGFDDGTIGGKVASVVAAPFADKFTTDSVFKNQKVSDFFTLDEELTKLAQKEHATDENILASKYINSIQYEMNELYAKRREIQKDMSLNDAEKYNKAREVQRKIDELARYGLDTYDQLDVESYYGNVNGMSFFRNNDNEWQKVDKDKDLMLNLYGLSTKEKSDYFYTTNTISNIRKDIKEDTPEGEKAQYKTATIDAITGSGLDAKMQNVLYDNYYSGKFTDYVNDMDISDEDKMAIKVAESKGQSVKDANGKTISNSKALSTADAYADAGVLDDVFSYIKQNGLQPSDFGLSKTVYNYSYEGMAAAYQKIFGESFGTGDVSQDVLDVVNSTYTSSGKKSSGKSKSTKAQEKQLKALKQALLKFLKAANYSNVDMNNVLKNSTRLSDVEKNVKKILQNA